MCRALALTAAGRALGWRAEVMSEVVVYTAGMCGYCMRAKSLLRKRNISFTEIDVTHDREERRRLAERTGRRTVPQIFVRGRSVGGYDELYALDRSGALEAALCE